MTGIEPITVTAETIDAEPSFATWLAERIERAATIAEMGYCTREEQFRRESILDVLHEVEARYRADPLIAALRRVPGVRYVTVEIEGVAPADGDGPGGPYLLHGTGETFTDALHNALDRED